MHLAKICCCLTYGIVVGILDTCLVGSVLLAKVPISRRQSGEEASAWYVLFSDSFGSHTIVKERTYRYRENQEQISFARSCLNN